MLILKSNIYIFLLLFFISLSAQSLSLKKTEWITQFSETFYKHFCVDEVVMKKCYNLTHYQCQQKINSYISDCAKKNKIPELITNYPESEKLGAQVGLCIGIKFSEEFPLNKKQDECIKI